jgi:hypothetical protein
MAQMIECLFGKCKALSAYLSIIKKEDKEEKEEEEENDK